MMIPKQKLLSLPSQQSGFTLIECLVAIIIVSLLMVAVAPAIVLSVGTRVQARRVELATEAARTYIDGVRAGTIEKPNAIAPIEQRGVSIFINSSQATASQAPPATALPCTSLTTPPPKGYYCQNLPDNYPPATLLNTPSLYCINLNGAGCNTGTPEGRRNFIVQAYRSITPNTNNGVPEDYDGKAGYLLGVRVYRGDAFDGGRALKTAPPTGRSRVSTFTAGVGDPKAPVVEMTTEIRTDKTDYKSLCARLGCQ